MQGALAKEMFLLLDVLWSGKAKYVIPRDFKWILSRFNKQFSGTNAFSVSISLFRIMCPCLLLLFTITTIACD